LGPSNDVLFFYAADLYVGPSLEDSFGLPILEARASGLLVIASAYAGASKIIRDGETGFILRIPRDHLQLVHLIRRIYTNQALSRATGESAARYVLANGGWDENAEATRRLLESTLQRKHQN
jgi:glycosyltransferase involved in cell wall biosynthesis